MDHVDQVKCLCDWTILAYHVHNNNHCKVLTVACCDMQFKYAQAQSLFLGDVMLKNDVMYVIIKGFTADNAYSNCIVMRKIYNGYDPSIHMEGHEGTHLFHWSTNMDKITKKNTSNLHLNINTNNFVRNIMMLWYGGCRSQISCNMSLVVTIISNHKGGHVYLVRLIGDLTLLI